MQHQNLDVFQGVVAMLMWYGMCRHLGPQYIHTPFFQSASSHPQLNHLFYPSDRDQETPSAMYHEAYRTRSKTQSIRGKRTLKVFLTHSLKHLIDCIIQ